MYTPITFGNINESNSFNGVSLDSSDETNCGKRTFFGKGQVKTEEPMLKEYRLEEPMLKEYRLIQVEGNISDSFLSDIISRYYAKSIDFSNGSSNESFDQLVDDESITINEEIEQLSTTESSAIFSVENLAKVDLNPNSVFKESIQKFIVKTYGTSFVEGNESLEEMSKNPANNIISSGGVNELQQVSESVKHSLLSCSNDSSSSILRNSLADDDTDIEILEVVENSSVFVEDSDQNDKQSKLKQGSKRCAQIGLKKINDENEVLNEDASTDLRHIIRDATKTSNRQVPISSIPSKVQLFPHSNTCLIKEEKREKLKQNEQLRDSFTLNNIQGHTSPDHNTLQDLKNSVNAVPCPASIVKAESNEYSASSHSLLSGQEWSQKNAKLLDAGLEQNEKVFPNKQDFPLQNDSSTPATIIPSIPVAHGFKRYRSYTSAEHLAYLHELALSKFSELKEPTDSESCITLTSPGAAFTENRAARNCLKREACQKTETTTVTVSAALEDTHYKHDYQNSSAESWSAQGKRNNSLSGCQGMIVPRLPVNPNNEENSNVHTGYNIKMRSYAVHSLPKASNSVPISPLHPPSQLLPPLPPQLSPSSSSLSLSSSFSIAHAITPKHVTTADGQEWIMKLPESRKPMESLWPAYRPVYQPYTVYDSRFMQQRVQISQRPIMIAQSQSSMNPGLEQSHGCVNQYGSRFWGMYSPVAHRIFARQTAHAAQQQRMSTTNPDIVPHFIPHPVQRISSNHPVYMSQTSNMSPDVMPQYTSHSAGSKCKSLEEIVGRIKENNK